MQFLKNAVVVILAYYAIGTVVSVLDAGLALVLPQSAPDSSTGELPEAFWLGWHVIEVACVTVASAYFAVSALERGAVVRAGILCAWMLLVGGAMFLANPQWPAWFRLAMALVPLPAISLGTYLSHRRATSGEGRPRAMSPVRYAVTWGIVLAILFGAHWYQNGPKRRYVAHRIIFWYGELPALVIVGALAGLGVGKWQSTKRRDAVNGAAGRLTTG